MALRGVDHALPWDEIAPARYVPVGTINIMAALKKRSATRVASNDDFKELLKNLAERELRSKDKTVSLNIEERRKLFEATEEEEKEETATKEMNDFILREAGYILSDYIRLQ